MSSICSIQLINLKYMTYSIYNNHLTLSLLNNVLVSYGGGGGECIKFFEQFYRNEIIVLLNLLDVNNY